MTDEWLYIPTQGFMSGKELMSWGESDIGVWIVLPVRFSDIIIWRGLAIRSERQSMGKKRRV